LARSAYGDRLTGSDDVKGNDSDDTIEGRGGADVLDGGAGTNTLSCFSSPAGFGRSRAGIASGGDADGDKFKNFQNVTGAKFAGNVLKAPVTTTISGATMMMS
jgi:Ca2+-binding RTX toxin-like protein